MSDEIEKVENKYDRALRIEEERKAELHEMAKVEFVGHQNERESVLKLHEYMRQQAEQVAAMASADARLASDRQRGIRASTDARVQELAESKFVTIGNAAVRVSSIIAIVEDGPRCSKALCIYGVTVPLSVTREAAADALRSVQD